MPPQNRQEALDMLRRALHGDLSTVTSPQYPNAPYGVLRDVYTGAPRMMQEHDYRNFGAGVQSAPGASGTLPQYPMNPNLTGIAGGDWNAPRRGATLIENVLLPSTPMPMEGLLVRGNIGDLYNRQTLTNPGEGNYSTIETTSFQPDRGSFAGREVLIPTVVGGRRLTPEQAQAHFYHTGEHLGVFQTPAHADKYAWWLHWEQVRRGGGGRQAPDWRPQQ